MPTVTGPLHSDQARNQFAAALIYQQTAARSTVKAYAPPKNPNSAAQRDARAITKAIQQAWPTLTADDRATWTAPAEAAGIQPINQFLRTNWELIRQGAHTTMSWPPPPPQAPIGTVTAWLKSATGTPPLPTNWLECNGQICNEPASPYNGLALPNLNAANAAPNRFLRGAPTSGETGGADSHALTIPELPAHTHTVSRIGSSGSGSAAATATGPFAALATSSVGGGNAHENRPPFYNVVWIIRIL